MSSHRLPGKVLRPLLGTPMIAYLIERLAQADGLDAIILATSTDASDDGLAAFAAGRGIACHRGALADVGGRMLEAARRHRLDALVRVNGDSPLLDPALVAKGIALFRRGGSDLVTNVRPRSYPKGQSVEIVAVEALARAMEATQDRADREHVTPFLYAHPEHFRVTNFAAASPRPELQLSIDTDADAARIEAMMARMTRAHLAYGVEALIALADAVGAEAAAE
ncbi:MAG: NTP transferase domain-containing protein [Alphaproteobacteria bacterium]|nr:NTP transferase domain-containing protein [Alphaproteobacteria bacterium]